MGEPDLQSDPGFEHEWITVCTYLPRTKRLSQARLRRRHPAWLNQVEIWFVRMERDVIARGVFTSVQDLARKLMRYIRAYSKVAQPFRWKYSDVTKRIRPC